MEKDKSDDRLNMLLGKKENNSLNKMLGKEHTRGKYEKELVEKKIKCPKCGHEFEAD
jgi:hypothetical protein